MRSILFLAVAVALFLGITPSADAGPIRNLVRSVFDRPNHAKASCATPQTVRTGAPATANHVQAAPVAPVIASPCPNGVCPNPAVVGNRFTLPR